MSPVPPPPSSASSKQWRMAVSAPLASSGGSVTAVPMIWVMIVGVAGSLFAYLVLARPSADRTIESSPTH